MDPARDPSSQSIRNDGSPEPTAFSGVCRPALAVAREGPDVNSDVHATGFGLRKASRWDVDCGFPD